MRSQKKTRFRPVFPKKDRKRIISTKAEAPFSISRKSNQHRKSETYSRLFQHRELQALHVQQQRVAQEQLVARHAAHA